MVGNTLLQAVGCTLHQPSPIQVIAAIAPFISEARKARMDQVLKQRTRSIVPVLEDIFDQGNVCAVMRTAEAFGLQDFHSVQSGALTKFKAANRVTQGADKWLSHHRHNSAVQCVEALKKQGYRVLCTSLSAESVRMDEVAIAQPTALVFGSENSGASAEMQALAHGSLIIPMVGFAQSFNISVAAAVVLYHCILKAKEHFGEEFYINEEERKVLKSEYYMKSLESKSVADHIIKRYLQSCEGASYA